MEVQLIAEAGGVNTVTIPAHRVGDLLLLACICKPARSSLVTPSGWSFWNTFGPSVSGPINGYLYWRKATSNDTAIGTIANTVSVVASVWRSDKGGAPDLSTMNGQQATTDTNQIRFPARSASGSFPTDGTAACWRLIARTLANDTALVSVPSGFTSGLYLGDATDTVFTCHDLALTANVADYTTSIAGLGSYASFTSIIKDFIPVAKPDKIRQFAIGSQSSPADLALDIVPGNTLILMASMYGSNHGTPTVPADNLGNTFTKRAEQTYPNSDDFGVSIWDATVVTGGNQSLTLSGGVIDYTLEGTEHFEDSLRYVLIEVTGSAVFDKAAGASLDWESGNKPSAGPTATLVGSTNLLFATAMLNFFYSDVDTQLSVPGTWFDLGRVPNGWGPGCGFAAKTYNSSAGPAVSWDAIPTGAGTGSIGHGLIAAYTIPAAAQSIGITGGPATFAAGTLTIQAAPWSIEIPSRASEYAAGTLTLAPGAATIALAGLPPAFAAGALSFAPGDVAIELTGLPSGFAAGAMTILPAPQAFSLDSRPSEYAAGALALAPGAATIGLSGLGTAFAAGALSFAPGAAGIAPGSGASGFAAGVLAIAPGARSFSLSGGPPAFATGTVTIALAGTQAFSLLGGPRAFAAGTLAIGRGAVSIGVPSRAAEFAAGVMDFNASPDQSFDLIGGPPTFAAGTFAITFDSTFSLVGKPSDFIAGTIAFAPGALAIAIPSRASQFTAGTISFGSAAIDIGIAGGPPAFAAGVMDIRNALSYTPDPRRTIRFGRPRTHIRLGD